MRVTLRPVDAAGLADYLSTAVANLARELSAAMRLPLAEARERARRSVGEVIRGPEPSDIRDGAFLCSVIRPDGGVVGVVLFGHQADRRRYYIWDIVIDRVCRGRGYGRAAMEAIEEHGRARGVEVIELNVFARNTVARQLYDSLGYAEAGVRMIKTVDD